MKIIQLLIYLLIWCQAAETLYQLTDLGQNVTINCDLDEGDIYWLLLKVPDPPVMILHTLSTTSLFFNTTFRQKYSVQSKNHLFINNITVNELGVYYCMKTDTPPKFSTGIRLQINEESSEVHCINQNHTVVKFIEQNRTHWMIIIHISALLHGVLVIVVIAGGCYHCAKKQTPKDARLQQTQPVEQLEETMSYTLYTAVSFTSL
ncbi:uncharacterized protein LOC130549239 [Triplophysa rosa]|uniref:uncharacterized protein LOC130549239 n=1 Tax=Triplophysa rosa TaxID=992332 RepID=UPI00254612F2|nr:uncharacterized protein LOC130549239 [Triplophysa rosa]